MVKLNRQRTKKSKTIIKRKQDERAQIKLYIDHGIKQEILTPTIPK